ncbi:MAG: restriction endonuclease subunit S [Prevotella sp.]|nr:restriction endonuclease subunit S [Prevotella sp.]
MKSVVFKSVIIPAHNFRFDSRHYLNEHALNSLLLEQNSQKCKQLSEFALLFNPPVFKRQFCKLTPRAVQYFQSSDVQNSSENSSVYIYGKQAQDLNLLVHTGDILVTGFGTIGNSRLVSRFQNGVCYANNVCRIKVNNNFKKGYIYAFMRSKYGVSQLNKNASGSVVRYIEAPGIGKTLVPLFPESFQKEIDDLIQESARLREEATNMFGEVHKIIEGQIKTDIEDSKYGIVSSQNISLSHNKRFEATYYVSQNRRYYDYIINKTSHANLSDLCSHIFRPGIFKRQYVQREGIMFLGGADILNAIPYSNKKLSYKQVLNMPELIPEEGTILVTCGGTIGNVVYVDKQLSTCAVSQHVMRIIPNGTVPNGYLYAFLSSHIGHELINMFSFGSVIPQIEPHHLGLVPVPILDISLMNNVDELCRKSINDIEQAKEKETHAISLVEQEIESWNKN